MSTLPPEDSRQVEGGSPFFLTQGVYVAGSLLINGFLALQIVCLRRLPIYHSSGLFRYILPSAVVVNLLATTLLIALRPKTLHRSLLPRLRLCDWVCAALPLLLIVLLRVPGVEDKRPFFTLIYTVCVFARIPLFALWARLLRDRGRARVTLAVFLSSFVIYFALTPEVTAGHWPDGDEAHYLLLTYSLLHDHDFNLRNNYDRQDYRSYFPPDFQSYPPDRHVVLNPRGEQMPFHDVGLSAILLPGFAAGNRLGAMIEMNLFGAALAAGIFELSLALRASTEAAIGTWALFAFVSPLVTFACQIYPEIPASALTVWAIAAFAGYIERRSSHAMPLAGCLLALGPWLSIRYWVVLGSLALVMAIYVIRRARPLPTLWRDLAWLTIPTVVSLLAFCVFDLSLFGRFEPNAGYILFVPTTQFPMFRPQAHVGLLGLFFDGSFGLLPMAPIYLVAIAGIRPAFREHKVLSLALLAPVVSVILFTAPNHWWYGGVTPPPSRYIVMAAAPLAAFAGVALSRVRAKVVVAALAAWSFLVAIEFMAFQVSRHAFWDIRATGIVNLFFRVTRLNLGLVFPSFLQPGARDYLLAAVWTAIAAAVVASLLRSWNSMPRHAARAVVE